MAGSRAPARDRRLRRRPGGSSARPSERVLPDRADRGGIPHDRDDGPESPHGIRGPGVPGACGLLRNRRLHDGDPHRQVPLAGGRRNRRRNRPRPGGRRRNRRADAAPPGALSGDGDAGLRHYRLHRPERSHRPHRRSVGPHRHPEADRRGVSGRDGPGVLLRRVGRGAAPVPAGPEPGAVASRAGAAGDPYERDGGRGPGGGHAALQDRRLHPERTLRRGGGDALRALRDLRLAREASGSTRPSSS